MTMQISSSSPPPSSSTSNSYQLGVVKRLFIASCICACFVGFELVSGYISGSLAIWSDALHLSTDLFAFLIAIATSYLASKKSTKTFTYGFKRLESVAALFSVGSLVVVTIWLLFESISRFGSLLIHAESDDDGVFSVDGSLMSVTAMLGVVVNIVLACILRENHVHLPGSGCNHNHSSGFRCSHETSSSQQLAPKDGLTDDNNIEMLICRPCAPAASTCNHNHPSGFSCSHETSSFQQLAPKDGLTGDNDIEMLICRPRTPGVPTSEENTDEAGVNQQSNSWGLPFVKNPSSEQNYQLVTDDTTCSSSKVSTNVNLDAAYLHALTDLAQSVIVLITGCVIWWKPNWYLLDPFLTFIFSLMVLWGSKNIIIRSISVLLEVIPQNIDYDEVFNTISGIPNVTKVCGLRIWSVSDSQIGLTCHINAATNSSNRNVNAVILRTVLAALKESYAIDSQFVTIQIYQSDADICPSCGYDSPEND